MRDNPQERDPLIEPFALDEIDLPFATNIDRGQLIGKVIAYTLNKGFYLNYMFYSGQPDAKTRRTHRFTIWKYLNSEMCQVSRIVDDFTLEQMCMEQLDYLKHVADQCMKMVDDELAKRMKQEEA